VIIATIKASLGNALIKEIHDSGNFAAQHNALLCQHRHGNIPSEATVAPGNSSDEAMRGRNAALVSVQDFS
jgi:hypothetical protein